jgi:hypothetical protein
LQLPDKIPPILRPLQRAMPQHPPIALPCQNDMPGIQEILVGDFFCLCRQQWWPLLLFILSNDLPGPSGTQDLPSELASLQTRAVLPKSLGDLHLV